MKNIFTTGTAALGILLWTPLTSFAAAGRTHPGQANDFGIGAIIGSPTGLTAKYWYNRHNAVDATLGWNFSGPDQVQINADHLWHVELESLKVPQGRLPAYVGIGLRVLAGNDSEAGIRIPLGLSYLFAYIPLEAFAEIAPVVKFAPDTGGDVDGGIGLRFYFK
jgi:hypothetical protein